MNHHAVLPANGLQNVDAQLERGSLVWSGTARTAQIDLNVWSWGAGSGDKGARRVEGTNDWSVQVLDGTALLRGVSVKGRAGVDMSAAGPGRVDLFARTDEGDVAVEAITGDVQLVGDEVVAAGVTGSADFYARLGGVDAVVRPAPGDPVLIHSVVGDVVLGLPRDRDYDIQIEVPPGYGHDVLDLGFDWYRASYETFEAGRGEQTIPVRITTERGNVVIYQVAP